MKYYLLYFMLLGAGFVLLLKPRLSMSGRSPYMTMFLALLAVMAVFLWRVTIPSANYVDFTDAYYDAGRLIHTNPDALYQGKLPEFVNLPIVAYLFTPISFLEEWAAVHVLVLASVLAIVVACFYTWRTSGLDERGGLLVAWIFVTSGALFYSVRLGNLTHFLLPLILAAMAWHATRPYLAGAAAALCAIVKLPLLLVGAYYVIRKQWALAIGFWGTVVLVGLASVFLLGSDLHLRWYDESIGRHAGKTIGAYNAQSVNGFLAHLRPENLLFNWLESPYGWPFKWSRLCLIGAIVAPWLFVILRSPAPKTRREFYLEFAAVLCVSILISPISWIHYYSLLLVPIALILGEWLDKKWKYAVLFSSAILMALPVVHTLPDVVAPTQNFVALALKHVLVSHYFFGGLLLLGFLLYERYQLARLPQPALPRAAANHAS